MQLGAPELRIYEVEDVAREVRRRGYRLEKGEQLEGCYLESDAVILVRLGLSSTARAGTILHELLHACGVDDERTIGQIEQGLTPVLLSQGWRP